MSKKFSFDFEPITNDALRELTQEELHMNIIKFKRLIREARKAGMNTGPFEIEFCYLDNERQRRSRYESNLRRR